MNRMNNRFFCCPVDLWRLSSLLLAVMLLFCGACGRKALPLPPPAYIPPEVSDFRGELVDGRASLSWTLDVVDRDRRLLGGVIRIFQAVRSLSEADDCPECPPAFVQVADYPVRAMLADGTGRLDGTYQQVLEPDCRYWYYAVVRSADGINGPSSVEVELFFPREDR